MSSQAIKLPKNKVTTFATANPQTIKFINVFLS